MRKATDGRRVTLEEMRKGLDTAIRRGVSSAATILWADVANEGSAYCEEMDAVPGSLLLGVSFIKDGEIEYGTLQLQPSKISKFLN